MSILSKPYFHNEEAAYAKLESIVWPNGPVCPHCGATDRIYDLKGKTARPGLRKCGHCRKQFTVKVGTLFESSHVPLFKWLQATYLMCASKKGISAHQLHRTLEVTYKTAWFMEHRLRKAMRSGDLTPFGSGGGAVEVDETFIGNDRNIKPKGEKKGRGYAHKHKVLALVDRETGQARSMVVDDLKAETLAPIVRENLNREARLIRTGRPTTRRSGASLPSMASCTMAGASTGAERRTPTRSNATSASSSAGGRASTSTAASSTCTAIWRSSISGIIAASS